jgi:hypothetical protein
MEQKSQFEESKKIQNVYVKKGDELTDEDVGLINHLNAKEDSKWQWMKEDLAERTKKQRAGAPNVKEKVQKLK